MSARRRRPSWFPRLALRDRIPLLGRYAWLNLSKSGISLSIDIGPFTWNSRGSYFIDGPGGANFRGRWRDAETAHGHPEPAASAWERKAPARWGTAGSGNTRPRGRHQGRRAP